MNWKDFFRLTKKKLIAFVITLILVSIYVFLASPCPQTVTSISESYGGSSYICGILPEEGRIIFIWPFRLASGFLSQLGTLSSGVKYAIQIPISLMLRLLVFALGVVGNLLYLYIISTLILKLIEKLKKKNNS